MPRRKKPPMVQFQLRTTPEMRAGIERAAAASGETISAWCRRVVTAYVKRQRRRQRVGAGR